MQYQPGILKHTIIIQQTHVNSYGTAAPNTDILTVKASIRPLMGKRYYEALAAQSVITHEVVIRYSSLVKPNMVIIYGTREFNINSIMNVNESNAWLQIMCTETFKDDAV